MKLSTKHWSATLATLAMTMTGAAVAQQSTGDPFLDAMMNDQQAASSTEPAPAESLRPTPKQEETAKPVEAPAPQQMPETHLVSAADETELLDDSTVRRELGPTTGLFSSDAGFDGRRISSVRFDYRGSRTIPDSRLFDIIRTREGAKYDSNVVNEDLERLISQGMIDPDARISVYPSGSGVRVVFSVKSANVLAGVGFTGNREFDDDDLREFTKLKSGGVVNDRALALARAEIIKAYQEAGYPDTKVNWRAQRTANGTYDDIIFDITEGRMQSMNSINFTGNKEFSDDQLRRLMETKERGFFTWVTKSGRINREQVDEDLQKIVKHYRNFGYLRAQVTDVKYRTSTNPTGRQRVYMDVSIYEGPRYRVRRVSFGKLSVYTPKELERGLSMFDGDIYSLRKVSDDVDMIRNYYGAKGYADADVRPDITEVGVDEKGNRLIDIRYDVSEGNRYLVGRINVRGNTKTKQHVILRELPLKPGQNLNSVDLETARKRLQNLNYFDTVDVYQGMSGTAGYRDVNINVTEKMTGNLTFGVAFSTVENVYLYTTVTQSNFDIGGFFGGSFVGGGQRLTLSGKLGTEYQNASVFLLEPWFLDRKLALSNEAFYTRSTYMSDYYQQTNFGWEISLRKAVSDLSSVKFNYRLEQFEIEPEGYAPIFFREAAGDYTRSHFQVSYEYDSRDASITPRSGGHVEGFAGYSGPGSTVETYTVGLNGSYYYNAIWDTIFSVNFGLQTIDTVDSNEEVPIFERCYLGGPSNLRGFRYRDVGMVDEKLAGDETMGGNSSAFVQFEVTVPLVESMRFAMFVDAGFVHADSFDFKPNEWAANYGIGLRINLPMGPLAVDYAIPFKSENAVDDDGQFQFYVDYKY